MNDEKVKELAQVILVEFESLLDKHGIKLLNKDRMGDESESCIYGADYYDLEDAVVKIITGALAEDALERAQIGD